MRLGLRNLIRKERFRKEKIPTRTETRISGKHLRSERQADSECSPPPTLHRIPGRYLGHPEIPEIGTKIRQSGFVCTCVFPQPRIRGLFPNLLLMPTHTRNGRMQRQVANSNTPNILIFKHNLPTKKGLGSKASPYV